MVYNENQNSSFLTMSEIKMGHILSKWKKSLPCYFDVGKKLKNYQKIDEKMLMKIESFLHWTQTLN